MSVLDRIILTVTAVLLLVFSVTLVLMMMGNVILLEWLVSLQKSLVEGTILIAIIGLLGVYLLIVSLKNNTEDKSVIHKTNLGEVRISLHSIKGLIIRAVGDVKGIKDVNVFLTEGDPIQVKVELQLLPDFHIPELTETVQTEVKEYLQQTAGISVEEIDVFVKGIALESKTRVE